MRVSMRLTRTSRISLGPVGLLILGPFILAGWVIAALVWLIVQAVEAIARLAAR